MSAEQEPGRVVRRTAEGLPRERVAKSIGKTRGPHSITFEVSEALLEEWRNDPEHWSEPVRFRFERNPWGWDLVMQRTDLR